MNREVQICIATPSYRKEKYSHLDHEWIEVDNDEDGKKSAFREGAKWADNHPVNVWHDASKFPNKALPIIVEIDDDIDPSYEVISIDETDEKFWEFLVSDRDITMWAYVKDLLPKGGEK